MDGTIENITQKKPQTNARCLLMRRAENLEQKQQNFLENEVPERTILWIPEGETFLPIGGALTK